MSAFEEQYINDGDLSAFLNMHGLPPNSYTLIGSNNQVSPSRHTPVTRPSRAHLKSRDTHLTQSDAGGESTLDIQTIMGVAPNVQHFFWSVGGPGKIEQQRGTHTRTHTPLKVGAGPAKPPGQGAYILEWAKEVQDMQNPPLITSHSYGDTEQGKSQPSFIFT